ncbi:SufB/SufD family protein [Pseudorhodobacter ferrugineus]|uniref:SufB/SufD family protein n=1 Tax=Pseudorhodobacter ferrugineus TaxID=77008 RepID=UPI0003B6460B|nr:SufD family Fe-S cluster assembly protein [Pseudorhodobacter ferrugineus]
MAQLQAKQDALTARLAGLTAPKGGFSHDARQAAFARLAQMGLPGRRDEYWRYTDPAMLNAVAPLEADTLRVEVPIFEGKDKLRLVFEDGVFDAAASDDMAMAGIEISLLSQADAQDLHWAKALYGTLEAAGQTPVARPFASLNTAVAHEGLLIRVTGKAPRPIHISYRQKSSTSDAILHHCIKVEAGADLTVLETGISGARSNVVMEADIAAGGKLHHIRPQGRSHGKQLVTHIFARLAAESLFKSFTLSMNGRMTRNEAVIEFTGDDAQAHVAGAAVGDGAFHHDDTVFITHDALRCESRQVFKKVLKNGAVGVFQGKILVKAGAQKTDGYQISQALMLDDDSQFLAKPELEIYADDVVCSHGSTSGAIDEAALFYLRSRGVPMRTAQSLLVLAFLAEAIAEIEDQDLAEDIRARMEDWLSRHQGK